MNTGRLIRFELCCVVLLLAFALSVRAALLPPSFINSVVAIGHSESNADGSRKWVTEASGFFYGYLVHDDPDPAKRGYEIYLVTNHHVIADHATVWVRMNPKNTSDEGQVFDIPGSAWFGHRDSSVDVSAARINWQLLQDRGMDVDFITSDTNSADTRKMVDIGVSAGDPIFVLGFPMNLAGAHRNYAIVRRGAIARVSDLMASAVPILLIDSHVFPGNSGGPVISEPSMFAIQGTKSNNSAYLLGVVRDFISYIDVAVSPQTQRQRVAFEENSGLAEVVPVDRINEAISAWRSSLPLASPPAPLKAPPVR
jgi:hypothetical protein